jgi:hypothetical protein
MGSESPICAVAMHHARPKIFVYDFSIRVHVHLVAMIFSPRLPSTSSHVRRIVEGFQPNKAFFNASHAHEAVEDRNATCLIICSACPATTKWLLAHYSTRTLFVVVHVPSGVTKFVGCLDQSLALGGKAERFRGDKLYPKRMKAFHTYIAPVRA